MIACFVLGVFAGVGIVAIMVVLVILLGEYRQTGLRPTATAGKTWRKTSLPNLPDWKKTAIVLWIMRLLGKNGSTVDPVSGEQVPEPVQFSDPEIPAMVVSPVSEMNDLTAFEDVSNDVLSNELPGVAEFADDNVSAEVETVEHFEAAAVPVDHQGESFGGTTLYSEERVEMKSSTGSGDDEQSKGSPGGTADGALTIPSVTRDKDDWASAFTDIQAEESQAGKLAKNLSPVDIQDLLEQCRDLGKATKASGNKDS